MKNKLRREEVSRTIEFEWGGLIIRVGLKGSSIIRRYKVGG